MSNFVEQIVPVIADLYADDFPEVKAKREEVIAVLEKAGAKGSPAPVVPVRTGPPSIARAAAGLLQSSVDSFFAKSNCGAWHHQPVAAMAVKAAREAGVG